MGYLYVICMYYREVCAHFCHSYTSCCGCADRSSQSALTEVKKNCRWVTYCELAGAWFWLGWVYVWSKFIQAPFYRYIYNMTSTSGSWSFYIPVKQCIKIWFWNHFRISQSKRERGKGLTILSECRYGHTKCGITVVQTTALRPRTQHFIKHVIWKTCWQRSGGLWVQSKYREV